jgi:peptidyl-prolyl cis-trans isomerase D
MRKQATDSVVLKVAFVAIVIVFMFWGIGTVGMDQKQVAALVNDRPISAADFDRAYTTLRQNSKEMQLDQLPDEMLRSQVLDQLITAELLGQEARRLGLEVDEEELRESIASIPAFQVGGRFSKDAYVQVLAQNRLKPQDFETMQQEQLLRNKLQEVIQAGVQVSDDEVRQRFDFENERVNLRYIRVPSGKFSTQVVVSDEDAKAYYDAHQEEFREPERLRIEYLKFDPARFAGEVQPTDEEIRTYYEAHENEFKRPEEVRARHILLKADASMPNEKREEIRARANEILAKARAEGADFAALAKEYSEDVTKDSGGDLGFFGRGVMTENFEQAAFSLEPGAVSDVVETPFGFHIVRVEEKRPAGVQSIEDARQDIIEKVRTRRSREVALAKVEEAHEQILAGKSLADIAAAAGLTVETPPPFSRQEPVSGIGSNAEFSKAVWLTPAGESGGDIVTLESGYVIYRVGEKIDSHIPSFDDVRQVAIGVVREERAMVEAKKSAGGIRKRLEQGGDIEAIAAEQGLKVDEVSIGRLNSSVPGVGNLPQLKNDAFKLTDAAPVAPSVYDVPNGVVVARLKDREPAPGADFDQRKTVVEMRLRRERESATFQRFVEELRKQAKIEIGREFAGTKL